MEKWRGKVAIVTGATSGIGAAVAQALVHHGMTVVGIARRELKIKELAEKLIQAKEPGKLYTIKADLRNEEDILAAFDWAEKELGGADVLVNNAGILSSSTIEDGTTEQWRAVLDTNILAPVICNREYLNSMKRNNKTEGHIFMINSVVGHMTFPRPPLYVASKHALLAISGCLRKKLAEEGSRIKVTDICPGPTRTELVNNTESEGTFDRIPSLELEICEIIMNPFPTRAYVY